MAKPKDQTFLDLPNDLIQLVVSHLPLKDNIVASSVCRTLSKACVSVRVLDMSPWVMNFRKDGSYELHDISTQKMYNLKFPESSSFRVRYSKDGWLLMYNQSTLQLLFFNPFTRDRIIPLLPLRTDTYDQRMAFSCAPTSTSCVLFTISSMNLENITIKTCSLNAKEWNTIVFKNHLRDFYNNIENIVFSNGVFYCLTNNFLKSFDLSSNSWNILPGGLPKRPGIEERFITEYQGKIFLIYKQFINLKKRFTVFIKLDHKRWKWTKKKTLGGLTIYRSSDLSSEARAEQKQPSGNRKCLCLSSLDESKRTNCICKSISFGFYGTIWVIPPLNLHLLS